VILHLRRVAAIGALVVLASIAPASALAHGADAPAPTLGSALTAWRLELPVLVGIGITAAAYGWAARRVSRAHPANRHPTGRTVAFTGGLAVIGLALVSPIEAYEGSLFSVHMVQHLLLELVAAPLLLLGGPITLALRAATPPVRRRLLAVLQSRLAHVLAFPVVAWLVFAAVNWGWHFSTLYDQALESSPLHHLQHATFLAAALLFWWPVLGVDPSPWRMPHPVRLLYLFLALPQNSFLGVALLSARDVLYAHYATNARTWGPSALEDQQLGGTIMWVGGDLAFLAGMAVVVALWVAHEDRRTRRLDARLAAERASRSPP
jgi:putative copper resistance protein D